MLVNRIYHSWCAEFHSSTLLHGLLKSKNYGLHLNEEKLKLMNLGILISPYYSIVTVVVIMYVNVIEFSQINNI